MDQLRDPIRVAVDSLSPQRKDYKHDNYDNDDGPDADIHREFLSLGGYVRNLLPPRDDAN